MNGILQTERLRIRPLTVADAPTIAALAGRREIADTTISIPHPFSEAQARSWIEKHTGGTSPAQSVIFALTARDHGRLIGAMGLRDIDYEHRHAELGFWIAIDHWGHGYATEAARAVIGYGFEALDLNRIHAHHMARNPASGRVLEKAGLRREGVLRQRVRKWGVFEDVMLLAILRDDWRPPPSRSQ